jgi:regulatory protein
MRKPSRTEHAAEAGGDSSRRPGDTALTRAVSLLSRREHSALELRRKLLQRGFAESEVDQALARLSERGLQDDVRFAQTLGRMRAGSGHGPQRLRAELAQHGLSAELVADAVATAGDAEEWQQRALELARRRWPQGVSDLREKRRLADFLARRGFAMEHIRFVMQALSEHVDDDSEHV